MARRVVRQIDLPGALIGLSIDYAIQMSIRHREVRERFGEPGRADVRDAIRISLTSVGVALALVTATTAIGSLSSLTGPVPPVRDFGVLAFALLPPLQKFGPIFGTPPRVRPRTTPIPPRRREDQGWRR